MKALITRELKAPFYCWRSSTTELTDSSGSIDHER